MLSLFVSFFLFLLVGVFFLVVILCKVFFLLLAVAVVALHWFVVLSCLG